MILKTLKTRMRVFSLIAYRFHAKEIRTSFSNLRINLSLQVGLVINPWIHPLYFSKLSFCPYRRLTWPYLGGREDKVLQGRGAAQQPQPGQSPGSRSPSANRTPVWTRGELHQGTGQHPDRWNGQGTPMVTDGADRDVLKHFPWSSHHLALIAMCKSN